MKKLITLIVIILSTFNGFAADKSYREKIGDKYYFVYSFGKAIEAYNESKTLTMEGQRRLANSYHLLNKNTESEGAYVKLINTAESKQPEDYFNYAMVLKSEGKYAEASIQLDKFNEMKPTDSRAKDYLINKSELANWMVDENKIKIDHLNVNTSEQDFGPCYYKNNIVFASSRTTKMNPKKSNYTGKPYLNMYMSAMDGVQLKEPQIFDKDLNGKMNDGPASFSKDGNFMAFTRNNYDLKRREKVVKLEIYFRTYKNNVWSAPEAFALNNKDYSVGHPCLTADGKTMYFVSDKPGGIGATDIYRTKKDEKGQWGVAENLGDKINTEGDEMFPFYEENKGVLFFASNGRYGLGGFDIYIAMMNGTEILTVKNAGSPLNTKFDDFAVIGDDKLSKGYFSTNRSGGSGDDDIYSIDFLKSFDTNKKVEGLAIDKNGIVVPRTFITLFDDNGKMLDTITTKDNGAYSFNVENDKKFKLTGDKVKYTDGTTMFNTMGKDLIVKADVLMLTKEEKIEVQIQPGANLSTVLELNNIYFDLDKYAIRPDAELELNKIVDIMNKYNDLVVQIGAYTDCRESVEYNQLLSDKRANASSSYIKKRITKPSRITGKGYGKTMLVNACACDDNIGANCTEEEHQKNRRSEFTIIKKNEVKSRPLTSRDK